MEALLIFEVSCRIDEVRKELLSNSFLARKRCQNVILNLPKTVLWIPEIDALSHLLRTLEIIVQGLNHGKPPQETIKIHRACAVMICDMVGIPGKPNI